MHISSRFFKKIALNDNWINIPRYQLFKLNRGFWNDSEMIVIFVDFQENNQNFLMFMESIMGIVKVMG